MDKLLRDFTMERKVVHQLLAGKSANSIAKELHISKKRIAKIKQLAKDHGYLNGAPLPMYPNQLFPSEDKSQNLPVFDGEIAKQKEWIQSRLDLGWKLISIYEELPKQLHDLNFSYTTFRRALKRLGYRAPKEYCRVVPEIITAPGEVLQLDWGKLRDVVDPITKKKSILWAFVGVMAHSRYMMVKLVWNNSTETTLDAIQDMFTELGGVPKRIVSDNPKCFAIEASKYEAKLNVAFERFCSYYNVTPELLPPRDPEKKGKVERMMSYIRRLYEGHGVDWNGLRESQDYLDKKLERANMRMHGTIRLKPLEVLLEQELPMLTRLPETVYEIEEYHWGKVRKDGHVRFRGKYYSLEEKYHGCDVFIIGNSNRVEIYHKCKLIETHAKITSNFQSKSTKEHHKKSWERMMQHGERYLKEALKIGPCAHQIIKTILLSGNGFVDNRKVWGILSLDKDYEKSAIEKACKSALEIESYSYQTVKHFLQSTSKRSFKVKETKANTFTRSTDEYSQLFN